jgi:AraC family transcriptional regulator
VSVAFLLLQGISVKTSLAPRYPGESRRVLRHLETASATLEEVEYTRGFSVARHAHDFASFIYVVDGVHWSGNSKGGESCAPRTVRFLPAGEPHENFFPVGSRCLQIELGRQILELARDHGPTLRVPGEVATPSAPGLGARLHREMCQRDDVSVLAVEGLLLELLLEGPDERCPSRRGQTPAWLLRVREMLYERANDHVTLADLSQCAGRHPVQVSRQFHQHFGCTISRYVRQVRVARAQHLLAVPRLTLAEIALASGFSDQSHFTNAFHRLTGLTPHRYRLQVSQSGRS